jgi:hypothetical protein
MLHDAERSSPDLHTRYRIACRRWAVTAMALCGLGLFSAAAPAFSNDEPAQVDFARDVVPILESRCYDCHGRGEQEGGLRLDFRDSTMSGGDNGPVIVVGKPTESRLIRYVSGKEGGKYMPPEDYDDPLEQDEVDVLVRWIEQGAPWPDALRGEPTKSDHWAYQRVERPPLPVDTNVWLGGAPVNAIDRFVLAKLREEGLKPSPEQTRSRLLRRVSLDLTGLPPTPAETAAFLADERPDAYERQVDRLLASSRFGERWAAWWLDLARYADTQGYEKDNRRTIWRYRDYVIDAFNADKPFNEFTVEQLAGDLLPEPTLESRIATAFHRNTMTNTEGGTDDEEFRTAAVVDRVNTTYQVWTATTMGCCQCHSHKYDPFTQKEYYQSFAVFNQTADADRNNDHPVMPAPTAEQQALQGSLQKELDTLTSALSKAAGDEARTAELTARKEKLQKELAAVKPPTVLVMEELPADKRRETFVHMRGSFLSPGAKVEAAVPQVLNPLPEGAEPNRLGFARWLVSREHPLTSRVLVNRLWEQLFGIGIVETSEDLGTQGEPPSHPELLDWLAAALMEEDEWSVKRALKRIVMSRTYRQAAEVTPALLEADPYNRLLARGPRVRLSAEMLRDQALAASGLLSDKMFGPSVMPPQPEGVWAVVYSGDKWRTATNEDRYRRGLYTFWRRTSPYPSMTAFDVPSREVCVVRRIRTNTPLQALVTLNDPAFVEAAQALARRTLTEGGANDAERFAFAARCVIARRPSDDETAVLSRLLASEREHYGATENAEAAKAMACDPLGPPPPEAEVAELAAWTVVCNVLLNLDEALTK